MNEYCICQDCHFLTDEPNRVFSNGKMYPCADIGNNGWEYWSEFQKPPTECDNYCKKGEYVPTGIWAGVAKVIEKVGELVKEQKE